MLADAGAGLSNSVPAIVGLHQMTNGLVKDGLSMDDLAWRAQARTALQEHDHAALEALLAPHEQAWLNGTRPLPGIRWRLRNLQDTALPLDERLQQAQRWVAAAPHSYYAHLRLGACWESAAGALRSADDPEPLIAVGRAVGEITRAPVGDQGFGFDPVMYLPQFDCTFAQLDPAVKNAHSHRGQAARQMVELMRARWL